MRNMFDDDFVISKIVAAEEQTEFRVCFFAQEYYQVRADFLNYILP